MQERERVGDRARERNWEEEEREKTYLTINFNKITILPPTSLSHNSHTVIPILTNRMFTNSYQQTLHEGTTKSKTKSHCGKKSTPSPMMVTQKVKLSQPSNKINFLLAILSTGCYIINPLQSSFYKSKPDTSLEGCICTFIARSLVVKRWK